MDSADRRLARRAKQRRGLFTWQDVDDCGVPRSTVIRRIDSGAIEVLLPGVMRHDSTPDSREARLLAALLYAGGEAVLCRASAAEVLELRAAPRPSCIDVLVRTRTFREPEYTAAVRVHRTRYLDERHMTRRNGLDVTTVERTICDLAHELAPSRLRRMLAHALRTGLVDDGSMRTCIETLGRFRGKRKLLTLLDQASPLEPHAREELESLFLRIVRPAGLEPTALNYPVRDLHGRMRYQDAVYLPEKLPIELDSRLEHGTLLDWHDDLRRQNAIMLGDGWFPPLRYSWTDLREHPDEVCEQIRQTLSAIRAGAIQPLPRVE